MFVVFRQFEGVLGPIFCLEFAAAYLQHLYAINPEASLVVSSSREHRLKADDCRVCPLAHIEFQFSSADIMTISFNATGVGIGIGSHSSIITPIKTIISEVTNGVLFIIKIEVLRYTIIEVGCDDASILIIITQQFIIYPIQQFDIHPIFIRIARPCETAAFGGETAFGQGEMVRCWTVVRSLADSDEVGISDLVVVVVTIEQHHPEVSRAGKSRIITESTV